MARTKRTLVVSVLLIVLLGVFAFSVPLPYAVVVPGSTADTLGEDGGRPVIEIEGAQTHPTTGHLLLTTIRATDPEQDHRLGDLIAAWWNGGESVVPKESVYPKGKSVPEIVEHNMKDMAESQDHATTAALGFLKLSPEQVKVRLNLAHIGGPSAGLLFSLGIIDKLGPGDLTGGRTISGSGTIDDAGKVGAIGGLPMKLKAAKRDGASVFLLPKAECDEAERADPGGLRLVPVGTLADAVAAMEALNSGGKVPSC